MLSRQEQVVPASTNVVAEVDAVTGTTNYVIHVTPAYTNVVYDVKPAIKAALSAGESFPWVPYLGFATSLLGFGVSTYKAIRNHGVAKGIVQSVEKGRQVIRSTPEGAALDDKFIDSVQRHQEITGVINSVAKLVQQYTDKTR